VNCSIDEYGMISTSVATTTVPTSCSEQLLATTALVPIQANLSLDVLNSAIKLSEKQNSAEVFTSDVIGAIVDLHWDLHAEQYWTTKALHNKPITLALLAYYTLYIAVVCLSSLLSSTDSKTDTYSKAPLISVCWEFLQVIITWCILTTAAIYKLDIRAINEFCLLKRAFCLFTYYG
jgi:hypothetical protein